MQLGTPNKSYPKLSVGNKGGAPPPPPPLLTCKLTQGEGEREKEREGRYLLEEGRHLSPGEDLTNSRREIPVES